MSYILDALRKADAERERDPARGIHAQSLPPSPAARGGLPPVAWGLLGAGVVAVAAAGYFWQQRSAVATAPVVVPMQGAVAPAPAAQTAADFVQPAPPPVVVAPQPVRVAALAAPKAKLLEPAARAEPQAARAASPRVETQARPQALPRAETQARLEASPRAEPRALAAASPRAETQARPEALPRAEPLQASEQASAPAAGPTRAARPLDAAKGTPAAAAERIFARSELPPDVQQSLPKLEISGGVYSDNAAQRMLIVAGQVVSEGAELAPGVVLDQIRTRSAVLRFRGWRYSVGF